MKISEHCYAAQGLYIIPPLIDNPKRKKAKEVWIMLAGSIMADPNIYIEAGMENI